MAWLVQEHAIGNTGDKLLVLLQHTKFRLIACFSLNANVPANFENRLTAPDVGLSTPKLSIYSEATRNESIIEVVKEAWDHGQYVSNDIHPDSILHIRTLDGTSVGNLVRESGKFNEFRSILRPLHQVLGADTHPNNPEIVGFEELLTLEPLTGRGSCRKVSVGSETVVYKGVSFFKYLACGADAFQYHLQACYREIQMVNRIIPPHPNIISPPKAFVSLDTKFDDPKARLICGTLYCYHRNGSLASRIDCSVEEKTRISLSQKAKWCYQLSSAIHHVHSEACAWHQDIKPPNLLLDDDDNLLVIDWEQCGANSFVLAPEADGSFDVTSNDQGSNRLVYVRYEGPQRVNNLIGEPKWNVFPTWMKEQPKAVELAEVYSLGSTMWLLLEQVPINRDDVEDYCSRTIQWSDDSMDIPQSWKDIVAACVKEDPNERIGMKELLSFWKGAFEDLEAAPATS
ncbi:hypothetical protein MMC30_002642 [Trapelia coarctata]|nr:hypothetical protein [Trapelia coarctata]